MSTKLTLIAMAAQAVILNTAMAQAAPDAVHTLDSVEVSAEATNASEVTKSYENPAVSSSTGLTLSRRETPQSVSTVTRQQMDDENVTTLDDALLHATGITATQMDVGGRVTYRARGYAVNNFKVDGATIYGNTDFTGAGMSLNMDLYDRVEILRGANGLLGSTGDPSATVELMRKEARKTPTRQVSATVGNWSTKHLMADINQPFTKDGSVRGRLVVSGDDSGGFRDREENKALGSLMSLSADITPSTKLSGGYQYERRKIVGATWGTNVPLWFADGSPTSFSRSMSSSANWSFSKRESKTAFISLEHEFDNRWKTSFTASRTEGDATSHLAVAKANSNDNKKPNLGFWNQDGTGAYLNTMFNENKSVAKNAQWTLNGPFELLGRQHQFMLGVNGSDLKDTGYGLSCKKSDGTQLKSCMNRINDQFRIDDWREFTSSGSTIGEVTATRTGINTTTRMKTYGGYIATQLNITDPLSVIVGTRLSWQKNYKNDTLSSEFKHKFTPYLGLVYDLNENYSLYASYTDIFEAQSQRKLNGDYVDPKTGQSYEAGIKGEWLDGYVDGSFAVFYTKQKNLATPLLDANGDNVTFEENGNSINAYTNGLAGVRTKGFEIDFSGRITPNWNVYGGYTYLSYNNPNSTSTSEAQPRQLLRLNTSYRLPGALNRLTIGGGMTAQTSMRNTATGTSHPTLGRNVNIDYKGYSLFHAMARYDINKNIVATFNVSNLFDKTYYRQYGFYSGAIYGQPRTYSLNVRANF